MYRGRIISICSQISWGRFCLFSIVSVVAAHFWKGVQLRKLTPRCFGRHFPHIGVYKGSLSQHSIDHEGQRQIQRQTRSPLLARRAPNRPNPMFGVRYKARPYLLTDTKAKEMLFWSLLKGQRLFHRRPELSGFQTTRLAAAESRDRAQP